MKVELNFPFPVTAGYVATVDRLIGEGRIKDGDSFTPAQFAELLGCDHVGGERACGSCLGED